MTYQKVIKIGNSLAATLPAEYCRNLEIKRGDDVNVFVDYMLSPYDGKQVPVIIILRLPQVRVERVERSYGT